MKVRMLTSMAGENFVWNNGDEIEVPDSEGKRFIEAGIAEPVSTAPKKETASKKTPAKRTATKG